IIRRPEYAVGSRNERVVGLERNEDRAVAALGDEIEAVIEELAEEREPRIERRRQPDVRRHVVELEDLSIVGGAEQTVQTGAGDDMNAIFQNVVGGVEKAIGTWIEGGRIGRRVIGGLIDDQVADGARR